MKPSTITKTSRGILILLVLIQVINWYSEPRAEAFFFRLKAKKETSKEAKESSDEDQSLRGTFKCFQKFATHMFDKKYKMSVECCRHCFISIHPSCSDQDKSMSGSDSRSAEFKPEYPTGVPTILPPPSLAPIEPTQPSDVSITRPIANVIDQGINTVMRIPETVGKALSSTTVEIGTRTNQASPQTPQTRQMG